MSAQPSCASLLGWSSSGNTRLHPSDVPEHLCGIVSPSADSISEYLSHHSWLWKSMVLRLISHQIERHIEPQQHKSTIPPTPFRTFSQSLFCSLKRDRRPTMIRVLCESRCVLRTANCEPPWRYIAVYLFSKNSIALLHVLSEAEYLPLYINASDSRGLALTQPCHQLLSRCRTARNDLSTDDNCRELHVMAMRLASHVLPEVPSARTSIASCSHNFGWT